jgi:AraC family transcriptional regulator of adaptative response/methylated-DNA-[protein]-cysteine methyltransferase
MSNLALPPVEEMQRAITAKDASYEGVFVTAVRTTGIFCRPICPARRPKPENVEFFRTVGDALAAGYRPCLRCRPLEARGAPPEWLRDLLAAIERDPEQRWTDADLRARALDPTRVRRWFPEQHQMTFHAYVRARRLGRALGRMRQGMNATSAAFEHGYGSLSGFRDAFQRVFGDSPGRARKSALVSVARILTPLGPMVAAAGDDGLCLIEFADRPMLETNLRRVQQRLRCAIAPGSHPFIAQIEREIGEYFEGKRNRFDVPLQLAGSPFQREVWDELLAIPFGETRSYEALARKIGRPAARRAVGRANGDNRLAIVVPCHRVVGADGALTGYGGGLWRKQWLLEHERAASGALRRTA